MSWGPLVYIPAMSSDWWVEINESTQWQDAIFFALCAAYALVSAVALVYFIPPPFFYLYAIYYVYIEK